MTPERPYSMTNRSIATARTRQRILRATVELAVEKLTVEIVLADVAGRAGVAVQTVLRHFASRDGLFAAAVEFASREIAAEREAPVGDIPEAVRVLVDHYEARGTGSSPFSDRRPTTSGSSGSATSAGEFTVSGSDTFLRPI